MMGGSLRTIIEKAVIASLFLLILAFSLTKIRNWDIWWHLKTGEWILSQGTIPTSDFFTYTSSGAPWVDLHWGFQVLAWTVYHVLGGNGLILCKALLFLATMFVVLSTNPAKRSTLFGLSLFFLTVLIISHRLLVRPEALSMLFLAITSKILWDCSRGKRQGLYVLPMLQVAWVNVQGLFVLGLFVQWAFVLGEWARTKWWVFSSQQDPGLSGNDLLRLAVVASFSTLACLVNPYGVKGLLFPLTLLTRISGQAQIYSAHIGEFSSLFGPGTPWTVLKICYVALMAAMMTSFLFNIKRLNPAHLLVCAGFAYLSVKSQRNINVFAIAVYPVVLYNWERGLSGLKGLTKRLDGMKRIFSPWETPPLLILLAVVLTTVFLAVTNRIYIAENRYQSFGLGVDMSFYPTESIEWIKANHPNGPMFNNLGIGGCLIHALWPEYNVFIDGRLEVHDEFLYQRYLAAMDFPEDGWEALDEAFGFGWAVLSHSAGNTDRLIRFLYERPDWDVVNIDGATVVFVKRAMNNVGVVPANMEDWSPELATWKTIRDFDGPLSSVERLFNHPTPWTLEAPSQLFSLGNLFMTLDRPAKAAEVLELAITHSPRLKILHNNLGLSYLKLQRWDNAIKAFEKALEIAPRDAIILSNLGVAYGQKGLVREAILAFEKVVALDSQNDEAFGNLGAAYWQAGEMEKATEAFKRAAELRPDFADHHYAVAVLSFKQGYRRQAFEHARKAEALGHIKAGVLLRELGAEGP